MAKPDSVSKNPTLTVNHRLVLAGAIVLMYLVACFCPALRMDKYYSGNSVPQSSETWFGWTALLLGWLGYSDRIVRLAGKLRTLVKPHFSVIRSSLGNPHFKWAYHFYKPRFLSSILDRYPWRRRRGWSGGVTTAGNWRLALVCQHCCGLCLRMDFVFGAKNTTARGRKENTSTADERRLNTDLPNRRPQINREWTRIDANKNRVSKDRGDKRGA
jgi:hypothetical protein